MLPDVVEAEIIRKVAKSLVSERPAMYLFLSFAKYSDTDRIKWRSPGLNGGETPAAAQDTPNLWKRLAGLEVMGAPCRIDNVKQFIRKRDLLRQPELTFDVDPAQSRQFLGAAQLRFDWRHQVRCPSTRQHKLNSFCPFSSKLQDSLASYRGHKLHRFVFRYALERRSTPHVFGIGKNAVRLSSKNPR